MLAPGEIGTLAYACRCDIVDQFSDRARLMALVSQRGPRAPHRLGRSLLRLNFLHADRAPVTARTAIAELRGRGPAPAGRPTSWDAVPGHLS